MCHMGERTDLIRLVSQYLLDINVCEKYEIKDYYFVLNKGSLESYMETAGMQVNEQTDERRT